MLRNDILWKGLIEDIFPHFIPFFLSEYEPLFDLNKPVEFLDKELQQLYLETEREQETKFVDKLVKVFTVTGEEKWILIHIEVQGYADPDFPERMFNYFYRNLDRYRVPITAIAIFTDSNSAYCPSHYTYSFAGTKMTYYYNVYKVMQQQEEQLKQSTNPFAIAVLTVLLALKKKKLDDDNLLSLKIDLVKEMFSRKFSAKIIQSLLDFIRVYVNFAKPETAIKFDREMESLTENHKTMTTREIAVEILRKEFKREGRAEGSQEQKAIFVENLLRSTDFADEKIAFLAGVPVEFVKETRIKLGLEN